jgi:hypothetical protein
MSSNTIAHAIEVLEGLHKGLDQAFWEANSVDRKDHIYDLISAVHGELSELNKLSVQDHYWNYEPITQEIQLIRAKLVKFQPLLGDFVVRAVTAKRLEPLIANAVGLLDGQQFI